MVDLVHIPTFCDELVFRIEERFASSAKAPRLRSTIGELREISYKCAQTEKIARSKNLLLESLKIIIVISLLYLVISNFSIFTKALLTSNESQFIQILEALSNLVLISSAALIAIFSIDQKIKRIRIRKEISLIRSLVNELSLLQLEKDPSRLFRNTKYNTEHSPKINFSSFELSCYFGYSLEALEVCSAILSTYSRSLSDGVLLEEISDLQSLAASKQELIQQRRELLTQLEAINLK